MTTAAKAAGLLAVLCLATAPTTAQTSSRALSVSAVVVPTCTVSTAAGYRLACTHEVGATVSTPVPVSARREAAAPRVEPTAHGSLEREIRYTTISF